MTLYHLVRLAASFRIHETIISCELHFEYLALWAFYLTSFTYRFTHPSLLLLLAWRIIVL